MLHFYKEDLNYGVAIEQIESSKIYFRSTVHSTVLGLQFSYVGI